MKIVERKPVPIYEVTCIECKSRIQYKASEVAWHHITCPVCGVSLWANTICPVKMEEVNEDAVSPCEVGPLVKEINENVDELVGVLCGEDGSLRPRYCDRNICASNEVNGIGCEECEVAKYHNLEDDDTPCLDCEEGE